MAFFYTRCPIPNKCSLTIGQLAEAQGLLIDRSIDDKVGILALVYDPAYHRPTGCLATGRTGESDSAPLPVWPVRSPAMISSEPASGFELAIATRS